MEFDKTIVESLNIKDQRILEALFDAEGALAPPGPIVDDTRESLPHFTPHDLQVLRNRETDIIKALDSERPALQTVQDAIKKLDVLINDACAYSPAYLNRAQARRLLLDKRDYTSSSDMGIIKLILADLSRVITIASPVSPSVPISSLQAQLLSSAHTHRGYLLHMISKSGNSGGLQEMHLNSEISGLEEMASHDFFLSGTYGDEKAKYMSVATNPFAKMCGNILREALKNETTQ